MKPRVFLFARAVTAGLLLWALAKHPIGYYTILRLVTCTVCAYGTYLAVQWEKVGWAFMFGAVVVSFQPFITFRMTKETWGQVDLVTAVLLIASIFYSANRHSFFPDS